MDLKKDVEIDVQEVLEACDDDDLMEVLEFIFDHSDDDEKLKTTLIKYQDKINELIN